MSDTQESPKQGSNAGEMVQAATTQAELAATKLATAKAILQAAEKEYDEAMGAVAKAAAEAEKEYAAIAKAASSAAATSKPFTNKRNQERIFRREMGEPEFFRYKKDVIPKRIMLSEEEQEEISRKVEEFPVDATPQYLPKHVLSPEYAGTSNYESGITDLLAQAKQKLASLQDDPNSAEEVMRAQKDLDYLNSLYESYHFGMNVFRTAQNGRAKIEHAK